MPPCARKTSVFQVLTHSIAKTSLWGWMLLLYSITDKETDAPKFELMYPKSHNG